MLNSLRMFFFWPHTILSLDQDLYLQMSYVLEGCTRDCNPLNQPLFTHLKYLLIFLSLDTLQFYVKKWNINYFCCIFKPAMSVEWNLTIINFFCHYYHTEFLEDLAIISIQTMILKKIVWKRNSCGIWPKKVFRDVHRLLKVKTLSQKLRWSKTLSLKGMMMCNGSTAGRSCLK